MGDELSLRRLYQAYDHNEYTQDFHEYEESPIVLNAAVVLTQSIVRFGKQGFSSTAVSLLFRV